MENIANHLRKFKKKCFIKSYDFEIEALNTLSLPPYKGSTLRGGLGNALKKISCVSRGKRYSCSNCPYRAGCVYSYVFETPADVEIPVLGKVNFSPHPFVLEPPLDNKQIYNLGDKLLFSLILIGRANHYLPFFISAFEKLGEIGIGKGRGKYILKEVKTAYTPETVLYKDTKGFIFPDEIKSDLQNKHLNPHRKNDEITLNFLTPTRIMYLSKLLTKELPFHVLLSRLLERIKVLSDAHCGLPLSLPGRELLNKSKKVSIKESNLYFYNWERYSNRQKKRMQLGGLVGKITYKGDIKVFIPFLKIGTYLHVGKNTSFGLGKFRIVKK